MEAVFDEIIFTIANPFGVLAKHAKKGFLHIHDHFIPHPRNNYIPHILGKRSLGLFSLLLLSVKVATIALLTAGPVLPAYSSAITTSNIFRLTNQSRGDNSLKALTYNDALARAAQNKAEALLTCDCFQHNLPDGRTPWDFIKAQRYSYLVAGENLAVDFSQAENVEEAWMNSPGHRANILNKDYEEIGVGISQGTFQGHTAIFVVQMFGRPLASPVAPQNSPALTAAQNKIEPAKEIKATAPATQPIKTVQAAKAPAPVIPTTLAVAPPIEPALVAQAEPENKRIEVVDGSVNIQDQQVKVVVTTSGQVSKVVANFNGEAILLQPKSDTSWEGNIDLNKLTSGNKTVSITAYDMAGNTAGKVLAGFSSNVNANYSVNTSPKASLINVFGRTFDPRQIESRFYLLFATVMLTCLVLAIAVRRHVQHISLVANSSFVVIFAMLFLMH